MVTSQSEPFGSFTDIHWNRATLKGGGERKAQANEHL